MQLANLPCLPACIRQLKAKPLYPKTLQLPSHSDPPQALRPIPAKPSLGGSTMTVETAGTASFHKSVLVWGGLKGLSRYCWVLGLRSKVFRGSAWRARDSGSRYPRTRSGYFRFNWKVKGTPHRSTLPALLTVSNTHGTSRKPFCKLVSLSPKP